MIKIRLLESNEVGQLKASVFSIIMEKWTTGIIINQRLQSFQQTWFDQSTLCWLSPFEAAHARVSPYGGWLALDLTPPKKIARRKEGKGQGDHSGRKPTTKDNVQNVSKDFWSSSIEIAHGATARLFRRFCIEWQWWPKRGWKKRDIIPDQIAASAMLIPSRASLTITVHLLASYRLVLQAICRLNVAEILRRGCDQFFGPLSAPCTVVFRSDDSPAVFYISDSEKPAKEKGRVCSMQSLLALFTGATLYATLSAVIFPK